MNFVEDIEICRNSADGLKSNDTSASSDFVDSLTMLKEAESAAANIKREFHLPYPLQLLPTEIREVVSAALAVVNCPEEDFWRSVYKCDEDRHYEAEQYAEKKRRDGYRIKYQELPERRSRLY
ncbi:hypothetical protein N9O79_02480 [Luminiphilus sp.]|nr:hypothetical protein [Luminiphilus sp.]